MKILVFDTETTDHSPRNITPEEELSVSDTSNERKIWILQHRYPHITQLSYIVYDTENPENSKIYNKYIEITEEINKKMSVEAKEITGIDLEFIRSLPKSKRVSIEKCLEEFIDDVVKSDMIVGHNVQFDVNMIITELVRLPEQNPIKHLAIAVMLLHDDIICTMQDSIELCQIKKRHEKKSKSGKIRVFYTLKWPKLSEAYSCFFGYEPNAEALHDALIDIVLCLRIFMYYNFDRDICGENTTITEYIMKISPDDYKC